MYQSFFGFQRPPFELVPDPDFLFLGESHDSALANLVVGIESGKGFVAISGPVGTGKTTVLRALLRRLGRNEKICFLAQPELETGDLLRAILDGFGIHPEGDDVAHLRRALLETMRSSDVPGILIIDEAHLLSEDALEQIRLLSNLEEDNRKLLQIILSGQPELKSVLTSERLRPLAQRIEMFYEIRPLDRADTHAYVGRRIRIAGNPEALVLDSRALDMIHECAGGIPRLINVLADRALITAYVGESHEITEDVVAAAYEDLGEISQAVMPGSPRVGRRSIRRPRIRVAEEPKRDVVPPVSVEPTPIRAIPAPVRQEAPPVRDTPAPPPVREEPAPMGRLAAPDPVREDRAPARVEVPAPLPPPVAVVRTTPAPPSHAPRATEYSKKRPDRDQWLAAVGIAAVVILAAVSIGGRYLLESPRPPGQAEAAPVTGGAPAESAAVHAGVPPSLSMTVPEPATPATADPAPAPVAQSRPAQFWAIQVASFRTTGRANRLASQLRRDTGELVSVSAVNGESGIWYRVLVGEYVTREEVATRMEELRATYDFGFLRRVRLTSPEEGQ